MKISLFKLEDLRNLYASRGEHEKFLNTYSNKLFKIENPNSTNFWDHHFENEMGFEKQDPMTKDKLDIIVSMLPRRKMRILDLGFGQGYIEERLMSSDKKYKVSGIDISNIAVSRANKKFRGSFIKGSVFNINKVYEANYFDVILAIELIEHIPHDKIFKFYKDVHSLLKKNGVLILSTPLNEGLRYMRNNPSGHVRDYQPTVIKMELEISKFRILESHELFAFKKAYRFKTLFARIFRNRWKPNNIVVKAVKV